jgi:hypothetical protein
LEYSPAVTERRDSSAAALLLLQEVEGLLKNTRLALDFGRRGVNTSLALVAVQGLMAYLEGNKVRAADDFGTVAEEIRARLGKSSSQRDDES